MKRYIFAIMAIAGVFMLASCKNEQSTDPQPQQQDDGPTVAITANGVTFNMILVEGGTFQMGNENGEDREKPVHNVTLSTYYIGETEVTQALWEAVMDTNPSNFKGDDLPVETVSYSDCKNFITKLNELTGRTFALPTEAQWEYAARGGNKSKGYQYAGSDTVDNVAWYVSNSSKKSHKVAQKQPNELGIYDMSGNVWEWCADWNGDYTSEAQTDPTGPSKGTLRIGRGGSWMYYAANCGVSFRNCFTPSDPNYALGMRLVMTK